MNFYFRDEISAKGEFKSTLNEAMKKKHAFKKKCDSPQVTWAPKLINELLPVDTYNGFPCDIQQIVVHLQLFWSPRFNEEISFKM